MPEIYTPGPWFADSSFVGSRSIDRFFVKCNSKDLPGGVAEAEANALLIASAPDMLAALQAVASQLRLYGEVKSGRAIEDIVNNAINKATGA